MNASHEELTTLLHRDLLHEKVVFLSASFPSRERNEHFFETADPDEITLALVATCRAVFATGGRLVFGGHPSVTPLIMMVAEEYLPEGIEDRRTLRSNGRAVVIAYQSESFRAATSESTRNLEEWGLGELRWVEARGEEPRFTSKGTLVHGSADFALQAMREQMLRETKPVAAIFIGGMEGIHDEAATFRRICEGRPLYFIGAPGGAARELAQKEPAEFTAASGLSPSELLTARTYPALVQRIVLDIAARS
jgi:hypothetical protein